MAVATKTITGKLLGPDGVGWAGGAIYYRLNIPGTVDDVGTEQQVGATQVTLVQPDGSVSFEMTPNDIITPADTVYIVKMVSPDNTVIEQQWRVLAGDSSPIDIGNVTRVLTAVGGFSAGTLGALIDTDVSGPTNDYVLTYISATDKYELRPGSGGGSDAAAIHDNVAGEVVLITEKVTPAADDLLLIEDSAAGNAKKRVKISSLPGGAEDEWTTGTKPAAVLANKNAPYTVKDPGEHAHGERVYERADGSFAYFITWRPF